MHEIPSSKDSDWYTCVQWICTQKSSVFRYVAGYAFTQWLIFLCWPFMVHHLKDLYRYVWRIWPTYLRICFFMFIFITIISRFCLSNNNRSIFSIRLGQKLKMIDYRSLLPYYYHEYHHKLISPNKSPNHELGLHHNHNHIHR